MTKKTYFRGALTLIIDTADADTPAMVWAKKDGDKLASSYDCATNEGAVEDIYLMSEAELAWLESFRDKVEQAFEIARANHPEYR